MADEDTISRTGIPAMSIIIVADQYDTIRHTIRHLKAQKGREQLELVIVTQSADTFELDDKEIADFCQVRVVQVPAIFPLALATSAGVRQATAPVVVLGESHAFPGPGWAQALLTAHRKPRAAVGAVMGNANPGMISWANLFVDYGRCVETAVPQHTTYLPGHHTAYKRDILLQYDSQLEAVMDSEILLHWDMQAKGHQLHLEPAARIFHANISSVKWWLPERYYTGRRFAATRSQHWSLVKRLLYAGGSPLIPFVRVPRVLRDMHQSTFPWTKWSFTLPPLILGLVVSAVGEMVGYLSGAGEAAQQLAKMELFKMKYLTERDRHRIESWSREVARQADAMTGRGPEKI